MSERRWFSDLMNDGPSRPGAERPTPGRGWFRDLMDDDPGGGNLSPGSALMNTLFGADRLASRHLGEYNSASYPSELRQLLARRADVARDLLELRPFDRDSRIAAVPALRELLARYPHPLVYEMLINASLDAGRIDEVRGLIFAARERYAACMASPYPEIRAEVEGMRDWSLEDIEGQG